MIAGSYPEGVIQVWDVESGRQLVTIESGYGYRHANEYFCVSPDWSRVYVARAKEIRHRFERDGKKLNRWKFDSEIRAWDLASGELKSVFRQTPMRGIGWMTMSPDGRTFMVGADLPGETEGRPRRAVSLVDTATGKFRELPGNLSMVGDFSPDSRTLAVHEMDDDSYATAIRLFDVATGELTRSIPIRDPFCDSGRQNFSPDGNLLVCGQRLHPNRRDWRNSRGVLAFYSLTSGSHVASIALEDDDAGLGGLAFSPDGRKLAAGTWRDKQSHCLLFETAQRNLAHSIRLSEKQAFIRPRIFSPDGRWLAVGTQFIPKELQDDEEPAAEDVEQPQVHFIDVATGRLRETLALPQGFLMSGCFSPDGKTLATGGNGRVLLWDLSSPPGE